MRPTKPKRGRPSKYDAEAAEKIIEAVASGAWEYVAAEWAGIAPRTLRDWKQAGKEHPKGEFGIFRRKLIEAARRAEIRLGAKAYQAALVDPKYALDFLRVRWRKRWDGKTRVEHSGPGGKPIQVEGGPDLSKLSLAELRVWRELLAKASDARGD